MEKLINFIEYHLRWAKRHPNDARTYFDQAFGAIQFYILEYNLSSADFAELKTKWNDEYRVAFEEIIYGGVNND